ncbi:MAG TPA: hypothetical protein PLZ08_10835 [Bacillota bacterium]|jgi:predicted acyltransferase (DUF342 family)|nr:hypothetical protein [Bacillota bacterium]HOL10631.1 hypothetical protein [Bacillota bacterium]HPO98434.1 hypothetical protein [Bacillota bacterium]
MLRKLQVDGDLTISDNAIFENVGIFCTGKVIIESNVKINGLIYAGNGLIMRGNPEITGRIIVNGLARMEGRVTHNLADTQYLEWLQ